ncbi:heme A synthase [Rhodococcus sp. NPDC059234]|uniref:COX15/CtaA family protein n=1 Tax=Rhodococcus sp. NPDC059234 TaxID=3346781 RepID=UPI00366B1C10
MLYRGFVSLVNRLPLPSLAVQKWIAVAVILSQGGIAVTGAVVRVTASGLGCTTWPQCYPGSFIPTSSSTAPWFHQSIEFGNRMLTFLVVATAAAVVLAVTRAGRRREVLVYAWLMPLSTVLQAVIGGITVLTGLLWWTVAIHLVFSMAMVWLSVMLFHKIAQPDDGVEETTVPKQLRWLTALSGVALAGTIVAGTMVTGAGPHAGDKSPERTVARLDLDITNLVHLHAELLVGYLALLVGLGFGLYAVGARAAVTLRLKVVVALVVAQALVGLVQFWTHVPAALVTVHVALAGACTAATAALYAAGRIRTVEPAVRETAAAH